MKRILFTLLDSFAILISFVWTFYLQNGFQITELNSFIITTWIPVAIFVQISIFNLTDAYKIISRYTSLWELIVLFKFITIASLISSSINLILNYYQNAISFLLNAHLFNLFFIVSSRLSIRVYFSHFHKSALGIKTLTKKKLILIGAGKTGEKISREILNTPRAPFEIVGFVDDDISKKNKKLHGHVIFGPVSRLLKMDVHYDELLITAPSCTGKQIRRIIKYCELTGKRYKTVPTLVEIIGNNPIKLTDIRDISYIDLLGRDEVYLDLDSIENILNGKRILITGAGGSIGSELVRQCLKFNPAEIVCVEIHEENLFNLELELNKMSKGTMIKFVLANVVKQNHMEKVFNENRPQIIFHAAAYKHVPLQELHPWTAISTNIGGTLILSELSSKYEAEKFVLVSTDKAVNPVNVMGATKRLAEKLIQSINLSSKTQFSAVRFGNVLGSSGSVIPIFQKQIKDGGPVTITHPEMTRYFMSIQEASQLILQSGALDEDGDIFLLEMGKPVKIDNMARDLIRLSGLEPEIDIPVVYTGLRFGEKLYEELQSIGENRVKTNHTKIMILRDGKNLIPWTSMRKSLSNLLIEAESLNSDKIQNILIDLIPTYQPRSFRAISQEEEYKIYPIEGKA